MGSGFLRGTESKGKISGEDAELLFLSQAVPTISFEQALQKVFQALGLFKFRNPFDLMLPSSH